MSSSNFSTWSKLAREALAENGCKLSHSQSMEVLAAGLGHNTYASFRLHDEANLASAKFVVLSFEAMLQRALTCDRRIELSHCEAVIAKIDPPGYDDLGQRLLQPLSVDDRVPRHSVDFSQFPEVIALAEVDSMIFEGVTTLWAERLQPLSLESHDWTWTVIGLVHASSKPDDFEISFDAKVVFDKCGRHLMREGRVLEIRPRGRPSLVDDGIFDGYVSGLDS